MKKEKDYKIRKEDFESFGTIPSKSSIFHSILLELNYVIGTPDGDQD